MRKRYPLTYVKLRAHGAIPPRKDLDAFIRSGVTRIQAPRSANDAVDLDHFAPGPGATTPIMRIAVRRGYADMHVT